MKRLIVGVCFLLVTSVAFAQTIKGRIVDASTSQPISQASVEFERHGSMTASASGEFAIPVKQFKHEAVTISSVGYKTLKSILSDNENQEFRLERYNLMMSPVEVRATRAADNAPFTKTNISKTDIAKQNLGQDLPYLLNQSPSVIVNSDAGNGIGYTGIRIRGTDATRINMTINGIPYNDAESQGLFFVNLPDLASSVNNIQVQRGVGTSSNGAGAFGATMNFSTNEVNPEAYAELNNSYGSFQTWKNTVKAGTGLIDNRFTLDARLSRITSDGYIDRASTDLSSFYISGAYLSGKTSIRLNVISGKEKTYQAWNGVSEADLAMNRTINYAGTEKPGDPYNNETDNYQQDHYQLFLNHEFNSKWVFNTAFFLTNGKGYYEQYKAGQSFADYGLANPVIGDSTIETTDLIRQLWLDNRFYGQVIALHYKTDLQQLTFGGGWNKYDGRHHGDIIWAEIGIPKDYRWYNLTAYKSDINAYAKYQRQVSPGLLLFADLQMREINYDLNGFRANPDIKLDNHYRFFNPKFGLSYSRAHNQVYLSYSRAGKEPNRDDFEASVNEQPKPEYLDDLELGYEWRNSTSKFGATVYYMAYKDQLVLTGKVNDVGAYTRTNIPKSYRVGLELQGSTRINQWFNASGNLTFSNNRIDDFIEYYDDYDAGGQKQVNHGNTNIAFSPSVIAAFNLEFYPVKNFSIALPGKYVGKQYLDNTSDASRALNAYFVQDFRLSYSILEKFIRQANLVLQVNNLLNKKYEPNGYTFSYQYDGKLTTENYYYPMAGTNYMIGLNISL
ncbi:MAG TPA: TonB-dependent receptor [Flavitalea sp.]|nr:TonB-dependent receptor [Flavitalea sp.]